MAPSTKTSARRTPTSSSGTGKRSRNNAGENDDGKVNKRASPTGKADGASQKPNKGLRPISMKVCKKVEEKGVTTYNEVADELVKEEIAQRSAEARSQRSGVDEKNIRRRVYDALNVLMAMEIISKEKKEIRWKGLPDNMNQDLEKLNKEKEDRLKEVERKRECLQELLVQQVCFRNLVKKNKKLREREAAIGLKQEGHPSPQSSGSDQNEKIPMPFIVVNTSSDAVIQCEMNPDRTEVNFDFSMPFEVNDDNEILKRLGLNYTTFEELRKMLPRDLLSYCQEHHLLDNIVIHDNNSSTMHHENVPPSQHYHHPHPHYAAGMPPPPMHHHPSSLQSSPPPTSYAVGNHEQY